MNRVKNYIVILWWVIVASTLFIYLQFNHAYHFFFIEQNFLFQPNWFYIAERLFIPGGFIQVVSEFLLQFYMYPYAGAGITTFLLILIAMLTSFIFKRVKPTFNGLYLSVIPALCILFIHFNHNYKLDGTIAFLLALCFFLVSINIRNEKWRFVYNAVAVICLFCLAGAIHLLYVVIVLLYEFMNRTSFRFLSLVLLLEVFIAGFVSLQLSLFSDYRFVFLPDVYFSHVLKPPGVLYFSWIIFPLLFLFIFLIKGKSQTSLNRSIVIKALCQVFILIAFSFWGIKKYQDEKTRILKKLDYLARTEQWDVLLNECKGSITNYLYLNYLNMALASKGELADKLFYYDQRKENGLFLNWNRSLQVSTLLSDIYFTIGHISKAQEMGFEAYVSTMYGNPRMLKRLIQTNLIYGEYPVAEKYIDILSSTVYYRKWAEEHRGFLYNDVAIEQDPLLGKKRKSLVQNSFLSLMDGAGSEFLAIAQQNPSDKTAIEYLGCFYLLSKDLDSFKSLLDTYYGTEILPSLPLSFQEAVIILYESSREEWKRFQINQLIISRFDEYKKLLLANKNNPAQAQTMLRNFGYTYWFYYMFK